MIGDNFDAIVICCIAVVIGCDAVQEDRTVSLHIQPVTVDIVNKIAEAGLRDRSVSGKRVHEPVCVVIQMSAEALVISSGDVVHFDIAICEN